MHKIFIIAKQVEKAEELRMKLARLGYACLIADESEKMKESVMKSNASLALVDMDGSATIPWIESVWDQLQEIKLKKQLPVVAVFSSETLGRLSADFDVDDFVVESSNLSELAARLGRVIRRLENDNNQEPIRCGDLVIDHENCEVSIDGRVLSLTFKEYELLKLFASNKGHVFTREALLDRIWGYDYFGGDRTVDVHIRRLRSKIETAENEYIETVRNVGYRFRKEI